MTAAKMKNLSHFIEWLQLKGSTYLNLLNDCSQKEVPIPIYKMIAAKMKNLSHFIEWLQLKGSTYVSYFIEWLQLKGSTYLNLLQLKGSTYPNLLQIKGSPYLNLLQLKGSTYPHLQDDYWRLLYGGETQSSLDPPAPPVILLSVVVCWPLWSLPGSSLSLSG